MTAASRTSATPGSTALLAATLLALGVVVALMAPTTAASARPAAASTTATSVRHVTLLTRAGHLRPRYTVTSTGKGYCWSSSMVNGHLYRCSRGRFILDPCWKVSGRRSVVCLARPWGTQVARIGLTKRLPATDSSGPALWGLRIGDGIGARCVRSQGASGTVRGRTISYYCQHGWVLLGRPDRSTPLWTMATARWVTDRYVWKGRHQLTVAWKAVVH
ncbi:MAG TPA: hypothetical protein VFL69_06905 [Marmoricola sp.]|nr:hypothetical protein [Marmoricola sp.]